MTNEQVQAIKDIILMARRYAEGRSTYAPSMFNDAYDVLRDSIGDSLELSNPGDSTVRNYPYATDGMIEFKPRKYSPKS